MDLALGYCILLELTIRRMSLTKTGNQAANSADCKEAHKGREALTWQQWRRLRTLHPTFSGCPFVPIEPSRSVRTQASKRSGLPGPSPVRSLLHYSLPSLPSFHLYSMMNALKNSAMRTVPFLWGSKVDKLNITLDLISQIDSLYLIP